MAREMLGAIDGVEADEDFIENKKGMYRETCRAKNKAACSTHGVATTKERYKAASGAARQVIESGKDFPAAVEIPGLGKIDFLYGRPGTPKANENGTTHTDGYGLSHIKDKHGSRALHRMPYVLAHGKVEPHEKENKRYICHGSEIAIVTKGKQGRWELTTFFDETKEGKKDDMYISTTTEEERKARK